MDKQIITFEQIELTLYNLFSSAKNDVNIVNQERYDQYEESLRQFIIDITDENYLFAQLVCDLFNLYVVSWKTPIEMWIDFMGNKYQFTSLNAIIEHILNIMPSHIEFIEGYEGEE